VGSVQLVVGLAPAVVDVVSLRVSVVHQLSDVLVASLLVNQDGIIHILIVVDVGSLGNGRLLVNVGLASGEDLDSALPHSIDLVDSSDGRQTSTNNCNTGTKSDGTDSVLSTMGDMLGTRGNSVNSSSGSRTDTTGGSITGVEDTAEPGSALGDSGLGNNLSSLDSDILLHSLLLDNIGLGLLNLNNLLGGDRGSNGILGDSGLLNNLNIFGGDGGGGGGGLFRNRDILNFDLRLASENNFSLLVIDNFLNFLNLVKGLVGLGLVGPLVYIRLKTKTRSIRYRHTSS